MNYVYCWSNIEECSKINKFIIVDNQWIYQKDLINPKIHDLLQKVKILKIH